MSDEKLINASKLSAKTLIRIVYARELPYADDSAMVAHSKSELQGLRPLPLSRSKPWPHH